MNYSGINAKIKAMKRMLLSEEAFRELASLTSVEAVGLWLFEHPAYKKAIETIHGEEIHRSPLERRITLSLVDDFTKIYNFIGDYSIKEYLAAFYTKHTTNILKMLMSTIYDERNIEYSQTELTLLLNDKSLDVSRLANSKDIGAFLSNLSNTQYSFLLKLQEQNIFTLEMQLDLNYYLKLWKLTKSLKGKNQSVMKHIIGTEIDLRNITWVYRFKTFYTLSPSFIYTYLVPINYRLKTTSIIKMTETKSRQELIEEILSTSYGKLYEKENRNGGNFNEDVEMVFKKKMHHIYKHPKEAPQGSISEIVSYLHWKEVELSNLTSLIEGVRYKLSPETILQHLYLK